MAQKRKSKPSTRLNPLVIQRRLRLNTNGSITLYALNETPYHIKAITHREGDILNPSNILRPHTHPLHSKQRARNRRLQIRPLDLPLRAAILQRHEAQKLQSPTGRHVLHCPHPQRSQRASVAGDLTMGSRSWGRIVRWAETQLVQRR